MMSHVGKKCKEKCEMCLKNDFEKSRLEFQSKYIWDIGWVCVCLLIV